jgi:hypothetical protein
VSTVAERLNRMADMSGLDGFAEELRQIARDMTASPATMEQPAPVANGHTPSWELVIADMKARDNLGRAGYGTALQPHNGRNSLVDAYQEALDLAVYLRNAIEEQKARHPIGGSQP